MSVCVCLAVHIVPRLPRKRGGDPGTPAEPRGVHPTPWQCTLSHACHAKAAETQGRQRNPEAYVSVSEWVCVCEWGGVCVSEWVWVSEWVRVSECEWGGGTGRRRRRRTRSGYRTKNKNPTRQCGEIYGSTLLLRQTNETTWKLRGICYQFLAVCQRYFSEQNRGVTVAASPRNCLRSERLPRGCLERWKVSLVSILDMTYSLDG